MIQTAIIDDLIALLDRRWRVQQLVCVNSTVKRQLENQKLDAGDCNLSRRG